jgi:hypothetical protein
MASCEQCKRKINTDTDGDPYHRTDSGLLCDECFNTKEDAKGKLKSHE